MDLKRVTRLVFIFVATITLGATGCVGRRPDLTEDEKIYSEALAVKPAEAGSRLPITNADVNRAPLPTQQKIVNNAPKFRPSRE